MLYRRVIYRCNHKFENETKCGTPHINEEIIKQRFVSAVNELLTEKKETIANLTAIKKSLFDTSSMEAERATLQSELSVMAELVRPVRQLANASTII